MQGYEAYLIILLLTDPLGIVLVRDTVMHKKNL